MAEYSYLMLYLPRGTSRDAARRILTDHAEYGNWELSRLRLFPDGSRKATLRRTIIRPRQMQLASAAGDQPAADLRRDRRGHARWPRGDGRGNLAGPFRN
jgi:uncharacterized protein DUF5703